MSDHRFNRANMAGVLSAEEARGRGELPMSAWTKQALIGRVREVRGEEAAEMLSGYPLWFLVDKLLLRGHCVRSLGQRVQHWFIDEKRLEGLIRGRECAQEAFEDAVRRKHVMEAMEGGAITNWRYRYRLWLKFREGDVPDSAFMDFGISNSDLYQLCKKGR